MFRKPCKSIFQVLAFVLVMLNGTTIINAQGHEFSINPAKLPLFLNHSDRFMLDLNYHRMFDEQWGLRAMLSGGARKEERTDRNNIVYTEQQLSIAAAVGLKIYPFYKRANAWRQVNTSVVFQMGLLGSGMECNRGATNSCGLSYSPLLRFGFTVARQISLGKHFFLEPEFGYFLGNSLEFSFQGWKERRDKYPWHFGLNVGWAF